MCVETAEGAAEEAGGGGRADEDLKTRTPHNDVGNEMCPRLDELLEYSASFQFAKRRQCTDATAFADTLQATRTMQLNMPLLARDRLTKHV